ncbi:hypothetical protein MSG28_010039 [Choristoneura fumiferana]|uniref:Uncharacterized protein n=2 Tax=Choristoneura fumiferana TaxID=7141 RepID=A0ACC0KJ16_CHOFU|nr:hypothetical protein MSG28_010039 [Choristoneura fumiferana]KAI8436470.1 hypothetical protein MSG28_010039 [Choristoneura fumiferana]
MGMYYNTIIGWAVYYLVASLASINSVLPWTSCDNEWNTPLCSPVVWVTALAPYVVLLILLARGVSLPGATEGIRYYLTPEWHKLKNSKVWIDAASQIFFSLGPGFGTLLALSSYNKFNNNCYRDALITSSINCLTSFLAGFVIFSVLGYMAHVQHKSIEEVGLEGPGLVFIVYPEAIATMTGSYPRALGRHREIFVAVLLCLIYICALPTTTYGGVYLVDLLNVYGPGLAILFVVFAEAAGVCWVYGVDRFSEDRIKTIMSPEETSIPPTDPALCSL